MATVKGVWILNETIDLSQFTEEHFEMVNVSATNSHFEWLDCYRICLYSDNKSKYWINLNFYDNNGVASTLGIYNFFMNGFTPEGNGRIWNFGDTEQIVSDEFYTWLTANATQQGGEEEPTDTATITYNGNVIATISDGQTATLPCKGKKMVGDIVVVGMALEIKYNGKTIAALEKGQTATIPCDGNKMATDIVVGISASGGSND